MTYISNWQRCQLICIFRNKLKKHVNQKQEFNQNLDIVKKLYFFIIIYICINLNLTLCKLSSAIMRDLIFQVHVLRKAKVIHIVSKGCKKCIHKRWKYTKWNYKGFENLVRKPIWFNNNHFKNGSVTFIIFLYFWAFFNNVSFSLLLINNLQFLSINFSLIILRYFAIDQVISSNNIISSLSFIHFFKITIITIWFINDANALFD